MKQEPLHNINKRSGVAYAFAEAIKHFKNGIGKSKKFYKKFFKYTPYIHGIETMERYVGVINSFKENVLDPYGIKRIDKIKADHIDKHFEGLIHDKRSEKTLDIHTVVLKKLFNTIGRFDLAKYIQETKPLWKERTIPYTRTQAFTNPEAVILKMKQPYMAGAIIQYLTGARVSDIQKVYNFIVENPNANHIFIKKSKGGRDRIIDYMDRPFILNAIKNQVEILKKYFNSPTPDWSTYMKEYTQEVKSAARTCNEIYSGPHAFRANYASERFLSLLGDNDQKLISDISEKCVLSTITEELGHSRISMAKYYISSYRR